MSNFHTFFPPRRDPDDSSTFFMTGVTARTARVPLLDVVSDTGKFIGAILAAPDKYQGETFCAAAGLYSWEEITAAMSKVTGKRVVYRQMAVEEFKKGFPFDAVVDGLCSVEEFGYWGTDDRKLIAWAAEHARGRISGLEEYLGAHPLRLE